MAKPEQRKIQTKSHGNGWWYNIPDSRSLHDNRDDVGDDPAISHVRTKSVFNGKRAQFSISRKDSVLLTPQWPMPQAGGIPTNCRCRLLCDLSTLPRNPETLDHWLQEYLATARSRISEFGVPTVSPG